MLINLYISNRTLNWMSWALVMFILKHLNHCLFAKTIITKFHEFVKSLILAKYLSVRFGLAESPHSNRNFSNSIWWICFQQIGLVHEWLRNTLNFQSCLYSEVPALASSWAKTDDTLGSPSSSFLDNTSFFVAEKETTSRWDGLNELIKLDISSCLWGTVSPFTANPVY